MDMGGGREIPSEKHRIKKKVEKGSSNSRKKKKGVVEKQGRIETDRRTDGQTNR